MFKTRIINNIPSAARIMKYINNGTAVGLTATAKEAQAAAQASTSHNFVYRNNWLPQSNKFGIRVKPASGDRISDGAAVHTAATWLRKQKDGGSVRPGQSGGRTFPYTYAGKQYIARPTNELRPPGSRKVLSKGLWPSTLKHRIFVIKAKTGQLMLMKRFGPGPTDVAAMYLLDEVINIKAKDSFEEPIRKVCDRRLSKNIRKGIDAAMARLMGRL